MKRGFFITFEGIEGSGKSTQLGMLGKLLNSKGFPCIVTREPGDSSFANDIRDSLLGKKSIGISRETELFLFMTDRADHVQNVVRPALSQGKIVLCDRYMDSTFAYQGGGRKFDLTFLKDLNQVACGGVFPDLTFLLDLPVEVGLRRILKRKGDDKNRIDKERLEFHQRVRKMYLQIARKETKRVILLDGLLHKDHLHHQILGILEARLPKKRKRSF